MLVCRSFESLASLCGFGSCLRDAMHRDRLSGGWTSQFALMGSSRRPAGHDHISFGNLRAVFVWFDIDAVQALCVLPLSRLATAARKASVEVPFVMKASTWLLGGGSGSPESIMMGTSGSRRFISAVISIPERSGRRLSLMTRSIL